MRELADEGKTIVFVTHDLDFALVTADFVSMPFDGEIACTEPVQAFFANNIVYRPNAESRLFGEIAAEGRACIMGAARGNAGVRTRIAAEIVAIFATPVVLVACAIANFNQTALLTLVVVLASIGVFFASYEASRPRLRDIMPTVVLAALAAAGRILFAPIPDFKPVSAIAIIAGVAFGRKSGFMVGALAALASEFLLRPRPVDTVANVCLGLGWLWGRVARDGACKATSDRVEELLSSS